MIFHKKYVLLAKTLVMLNISFLLDLKPRAAIADLVVNGPAELKGSVKLSGGAGLIIGDEEITKGSTISGFLICNGWTKLNGVTNLNGDARVLDGQELLVHDIGPVTPTNNMHFVRADVDIDKDLHVTGSIFGHLFGSANLDQPARFNNTANFYGSTKLTSTTHVAGPATFSNSATFYGPVDLNGALTVGEAIGLNNQVNVNNDIFVNDARYILVNNIAPSSGDTVSFEDNIYAEGNLEISGNALINGNLQVNGILEGIEVETFTGELDGDVSGKQASTVVDFVGGLSALSVAAGATLANNATHLNVGTEIVKRDTSGNIIVSNVTGNLTGHADSAGNFTNSLSGDVSGKQATTVVDFVGGVSAANVASGANAANAATSANTASTIVKRDANGDFSVDTIVLNALDLLNTDTLLINGNLAVAPEAIFFVDTIGGESESITINSSIHVNGDINYTGNLNNVSDQRIKTDINNLDIERCLAIIRKMVPREFNYNPAVRDAVKDDGSRHLGFIAQELAKIDQRFVNVAAGKQKLGDLTVEDLVFIKHELFIPLLVGALKAADNKIATVMEELEELQKLHARVKAIEARIKNK